VAFNTEPGIYWQFSGKSIAKIAPDIVAPDVFVISNEKVLSPSQMISEPGLSVEDIIICEKTGNTPITRNSSSIYFTCFSDV